jgi:NAD(P)-dependent dehydrogenase (short-subunit alcohol dehydrogenase family)
VNALAPGPLPTGFLHPVLEAGPEVAGAALYEEATGKAAAPDDDSAVSEAIASLVRYLLSEESEWLTGKLVSARWDSVESLRANEAGLRTTSLLTLRRIDGSLFGELDTSA